MLVELVAVEPGTVIQSFVFALMPAAKLCDYRCFEFFPTITGFCNFTDKPADRIPPAARD